MEVKIRDNVAYRLHNSNLKSILLVVLYFVAGFLLGIGRLMGELSPFGASFVCVSKRKMYVPAFVGAVLGYFITGLNPTSARYFACSFIALLGAIALDVFSIYHLCYVPMLISGCAVALTGVFLNVKMGYDLSEYMLVLGESIIAVGSTYFYYKAINANYTRLRLRALPLNDLICVMISVATLFLCLSAVHIGLVYPIRVVALILVLFIIRFENERMGITLGLILGFVLGVNNQEVLYLCGAFSFSALVAGVFTTLASLGISAAFLCSISFFAICVGGENGTSLFVDTLIACGVFLLTPPSICNRIEEYLDSSKDVAPDGTLRQSLVLKLRFASSAMAAISDSVDQVREKINDVTRRENEQMREYISEQDYITKEIVLEKTNQIRMVASDQFFSIADMLKDLAVEFDEAEIFDDVAAGKIRRLLGEFNIVPSNISVVVDKFGRTRVEILTKSSISSLVNPRLHKEIGKICNRYFDAGNITNFNTDTMLSFTERPNYKLKVSFAQHSAEGELCGDTIKVINDNNGRSILIISDGMGKGSRAALDGAMGAGLLAKLINAGFGFDSSLKVVNSALLVKSNDESLATLDIACVDLFTGKCELFKAGAPSSFIIKGRGISKCELSSMPAGILRGIEFAKRTTVLNPDDKIVLMSDGITDLGEQWLNEVFASLPESTEESADYILKCAMKKMENSKMDDMSVIFAKLERN